MTLDRFNTGSSGNGPTAGPDGAQRPAEGGPRSGAAIFGKRLLADGGSLAVLAFFAAGVACMYLLSRKPQPVEASAEQLRVESRVDAALSELSTLRTALGAATDDRPDVTNVFYYQAKHRQIPLQRLRRNPFVFSPAPQEAAAVVVLGTDLPKEDEPVEVAEAVNAVHTLTLQSVVTGEHETMAMISNNLLTKGQRVRGWTVSEIGPRHVVLTWNDRQHVLHMPR